MSSAPNADSPIKFYFAFGSNMNAARLVDKRLKPAGVWSGRRLLGRLDDWELCFNIPVPTWSSWKGTGAGNIKPSKGKVCYGTLNEVTEEGLTVLDKYECVKDGMYTRLPVQVWCDEIDGGKLVEAIAYVGCPGPHLDDLLLPHKDYITHFRSARDVLPADYVKKLDEWPCVDTNVQDNTCELRA